MLVSSISLSLLLRLNTGAPQFFLISLNSIRNRHSGRVEDGRGSLGHSATLRFPSPLIEPDVPD
jgi:hypothetical protein